MRTRAERRHHAKRVKDKFFKGLIAWGWGFDDEWCDQWSARNYNNRKPCSCYMCGNPRKHWKEKTIQERKFNAGWNSGSSFVS